MNKNTICDFYSMIHLWQKEKNNGKILNKILPNPELKGNKREKHLEKVVKENKLDTEIKSLFWHYKIKKLTLHKNYFESKGKLKENPFKQFSNDVKTIYKYIIQNLDIENELKTLDIDNILNILEENTHNLPKYAYLIEIKFRLKKPYISRDDEDFYIIDNPIVKDKVFKVPMVRPSTWKGALRFASKGINFEDKNRKDELIKRLFGNDKNNDENQKRGRLTFYPTFFDKISLEVITPLDRETKTPSSGLIYFETVPENTTGELRILYYPYDLIAVGAFDRIGTDAKEDFEFLGEALGKMFYEIGFSAKKTSGFGTVGKIKKEDIKIYTKDDESFGQLKDGLYKEINKNYNGGGDGE